MTVSADVKDITETGVIYISPLADVLMEEKLQGRALKLVKKAAVTKCLRRGVPEILKSIRKGQKGLVVFAADVFPAEVMAHVPIICEEKGIPYAYITSRQLLGSACQTKRAATLVMITEPKDDSTYTKLYGQVEGGIRSINRYI